MLPLIDSHCHLDFADFDADRLQIIRRCQQSGIQHIVIPGVSCDTWQALNQLCEQQPMLLPALGCHPMFMHQHPDNAIVRLAQAIQQSPPYAVGEIGLDFYLEHHDKAAQLALFEQQLQVAEQFDLPVILHVRKAHDAVLQRLRKMTLKGGIVHAFNGSRQQADQYRDLGFLLGTGGALTYPRATRLRTLFSELPLSQIVLETDAPDMPLKGMQGQRNSPEFLPVILETLASLRSESPQVLAETTSQNCRQLFDID